MMMMNGVLGTYSIVRSDCSVRMSHLFCIYIYTYRVTLGFPLQTRILLYRAGGRSDDVPSNAIY